MSNLKEKMFKVYEENADSAHLVISSDEDGNSDYLVIATGHSEESKLYFGSIKMNITRNMAKALGEALIEMAEENSEK